MSEVTTPFGGGCACGKIRYTCTTAPIAMMNCHCRDCQRATGGAFTSAVLVRAASFELTGSPRAHTVTAESGNEVARSFCADCGTPLYSALASNPSVIIIKVGSLDDATWFRPSVDLWTRSAQPWVAMDAGTTKVETQPVRR